jgi:hypothetical protein
MTKRLKIPALLTLSFVLTFLSMFAFGTSTRIEKMKFVIPLATLAIIEDDTLKVQSGTKQKTDTIIKPEKEVDTIHAGTHEATYYNTKPHPKVHRSYPTAAYNFAPYGATLIVTNKRNMKSCIVIVTDRMGRKGRNIDLSLSAFGLIADHATGRVNVDVKILD